MSVLVRVSAMTILFTACLIRNDSVVSRVELPDMTLDMARTECSDVFRKGSAYSAQKNKSVRNVIPDQFKFMRFSGKSEDGVFGFSISKKLKIEIEHKDACKILKDWGMSIGLSKDGYVVIGFAKGSGIEFKKDLSPYTFDSGSANDSGIIVKIAPVRDTPGNRAALEVFSVPMLSSPAGVPPPIIEGFLMNATDYVYFHSEELDLFFDFLTQRLQQPMRAFDPPGLTHYNKLIPQLREMSGLATVPMELEWSEKR